MRIVFTDRQTFVCLNAPKWKKLVYKQAREKERCCKVPTDKMPVVVSLNVLVHAELSLLTLSSATARQLISIQGLF